jgi:hypothetical protein
MYWRALQELVNGPLNVANSGPMLDAKYNAFVANGLNVENPNTNIKGWLSSAQSSIASQLAQVNATSFSLSAPVTQNNVAILTGTAPINVKTVLVNGVEYPLTWTSLTGFLIQVPLKPGSNQVEIKVTNEWTNRLIGDRLGPADKKTLSAPAPPPGAPAPPPLVASGLLGPVTIVRIN